MPALKGSCLCGAIQYEVNAAVNELRACHCTNCQKTSGAGGSVNAPVKSSEFRLLKGQPKRFDSKADSGRTLYRFFCGDCGSPIYSQRATAPEMPWPTSLTTSGTGRARASAPILS